MPLSRTQSTQRAPSTRAPISISGAAVLRVNFRALSSRLRSAMVRPCRSASSSTPSGTTSVTRTPRVSISPAEASRSERTSSLGRTRAACGARRSSRE